MTLDDIIAAARTRPDDVGAQIAAAYACDRAGDEHLAVTFYDAAWRLGVPPDDKEAFVIGYGSTLRNVSRTDEALALLEAFVRDHPGDHAARCFYGLALHSAGRHGAALAEVMDVGLSLDHASPALTRYRRALAEYRDMLRAEASSPRNVLRVARPTDDLDRVAAMYAAGLGLEVLGAFRDHEGFDGVILGHPAHAVHLEFTAHRGHRVGKAPTKDHLLVFYVPEETAWREGCARMRAAGFLEVPSYNPYWDARGKTFEDLDGYRVVLEHAAWTR